MSFGGDWWKLAVVMIALGGCGVDAVGVDDAGAGVDLALPSGLALGPPPAMLRAACGSYFNALGGWLRRCEADDWSPAELDDFAVRCAWHAALPGITVTADRIASCATAIATSPCGYLPPECLREGGYHSDSEAGLTWSVRMRPSGCVGNAGYYDPFPRSTGALSTGAHCDVADQCASGLCSSIGGPGTGCGVCVRVATVGEACSASVICPIEQTCDGGFCRERLGVAVGEVCHFGPKGGGADCVPSAFCRSEMVGAPNAGGVCVSRLAPGAACVDDGSVQNQCIDGALCRGGRCVAITHVGEGAACDGGFVLRCAEGLVCGDNKICRKTMGSLGRGEPCGVDRCGPGLFCSDSGRCQPVLAVGDRCERPGALCSPTSLCDVGAHCGPLPAEGAICNPGLERCAHGTVCGTFTCVRPAREGEDCDCRGCEAPFVCLSFRCRRPDWCSSGGG